MLQESPDVFEPTFSPVAVSDDMIAEMNRDLMDVQRAELDEDDMEYLSRMNRFDMEAADRDLALAAILETVPASASVTLSKRTSWTRQPNLPGLQRSEWWAAVLDPCDGREGVVGTGPTPAEAAQAALVKFTAAAKAA